MIRSLRSLVAPAFAVLALALATSAQADYTVAASGTTSVPGVSVTTPTITVLDSNAASPTVINLSYAAGTNYNGAFNFTLTLQGVAGTSNPGNETFAINGTLSIQAVGNGAFLTTYNATSVMATSGTGYSVPLANVNYATTPGNNSGSSGTIGVGIVPAAVPEPASVVMMGLGLVGTVGFAARRRLA